MRGGHVSSRPRRGPQQTIAAVAAALTSSRDPAEALAGAAEAIAAATDASRVEIWGGGRGALGCRAVWAREPAGGRRRSTLRGADRELQIGAVADVVRRPDLGAVLDGADMVVWRVGDDLPEAARAELEAHASTRVVTLALRVGDQVVGALALAQSGPTAGLTVAEKRRLALFSQLLAGALRTLDDEAAGGEDTRQVDALRAGGRAVACLVESDQAVEAVVEQIGALIGGRECRVRIFLRTDWGTYAEFPPRPEDEGENESGSADPNDLERRAIEQRRTLTVSTRRAVRLATPLLLRGAPLGYLTLIAGRSRPLTAGEIESIETLAQQVCLVLDIARLRRTVQRLTTVDTMTGLKNREFLFERLAAEIVRAQRYKEPLSLILIDFDDFARFNATHGNREGNRLLRTAANLVKTSIRDSVDVACRFTGTEFAVLLPNTQAAANGAGVVAERIRKLIEATQFCDDDDNRLGHITVSLGVAGFPVHAEDVEDLVSLAGEALRAAKVAGKNRVGLYSLRR
jgi:diguanylate cyclase (GGDEF)-like protein